ncbi:Asp-tRNA(Asn)/Glu-tRNA(Gln) amidotransferase subunit GatA [Patescibacteria group bacterium]|nr:Asp-tRNA(Asn)/Glu-tRNA(Gln) amidotransferase subunit GatA [Patescibacteria group bacterium]
MEKLNELTIKQAQDDLKKKEFSSVELTEACLKRIKERNKDINAFITVCEESALEEAKKADEMLGQGIGGPLTGIPFCAKDSISTKNVRSTAAAKILDNYIPPFNATVIEKIRKQGGVLLGKNNCDTFGHGASNENSMYGSVRNPHDLDKVSGGSSGGTAASVADNMCVYGIAEDTGGSIRQPASFCGIAGLRPSYGRNSRYGIMPMASSLDTVGPMAKTVEDTAIIMEQIAGQDSLDATTVSGAVPEYTKILNKSIKGLRVGVPKEYYEAPGMDGEVLEITKLKIKKLEELGCEIVDVSLPHTKYAIAVYYIVVPCEVSSNLGRLDGVRYGVRVETDNLFDLYARSRAQGFHEEVKRRILIGTYALSAGYYDAYYKKAQQVRTLIRQDFDKVFKDVDVLIAPASPFPAFTIGEKVADPMQMYLADVFTTPAGLAGIPGLSVPGGKTKSGLPVGIQIMGPMMGEGVLLNIGSNIC